MNQHHRCSGYIRHKGFEYRGSLAQTVNFVSSLFSPTLRMMQSISSIIVSNRNALC